MIRTIVIFALVFVVSAPAAMAAPTLHGEGVIVGSTLTFSVDIQSFAGGSAQTLNLPNGFNIHQFHMHEIVKYTYKNAASGRSTASNLITMSELKIGKQL